MLNFMFNFLYESRRNDSTLPIQTLTENKTIDQSCVYMMLTCALACRLLAVATLQKVAIVTSALMWRNMTTKILMLIEAQTRKLFLHCAAIPCLVG